MELGLPVVDADTMGRAFPEAQMASFAIRGLEVAPFAIADIRDNEILIARAESPTRVERIGRRIVVELGSIAGTCTAPRSGAEVKAHAILRSVSRAIAIGRSIQAAKAAGRDPVAAVVEGALAALVFTGKVEDVSRRTEGGFVRGTVRLTGTGAWQGRELAIAFQNEFAVAHRDGALVASVPDLITVLDEESAEAIGAEVIRYGQRVAVIVLGADPIMRSAEGLAVVGPRAFGYDFDYRPFEELTP